MELKSSGIQMPEKIGRYEIIRELGRGGMGVVWLAQDPFIGRQVAVKTTLGGMPKDPQKIKKFYDTFFVEAHAAGKLTHPNIVYVHDANIEADRCYLVLEYVDGPTLKELCPKDRLIPVRTVVTIIYQCAKALNYAHKKGVIHRDIKPGNIMISKQKNAVKITDFGIAVLEGLAREIRTDDVVTVSYASPEQLAKQPVTQQTDLFSLGLVMYELLTGVRPFAADTEMATIYKILNESPMPIGQFRRDVPEELERIIQKALAKDVAVRYKSGREMAQDLSACFAHLNAVEKQMNQEEKNHALQGIEFFKEFSKEELDEIALVTQWVDYPDGSAIISEGAMQDFFFIIISGQVEIRKKGRLLTRLEQGDYFGEMAYLGKTARTADVTAVGPTVLMRVDPTVIDQTSANTQLSFCKVFSRTLIQRLANTTALLTES